MAYSTCSLHTSSFALITIFCCSIHVHALIYLLSASVCLEIYLTINFFRRELSFIKFSLNPGSLVGNCEKKNRQSKASGGLGRKMWFPLFTKIFFALILHVRAQSQANLVLLVWAYTCEKYKEIITSNCCLNISLHSYFSCNVQCKLLFLERIITGRPYKINEWP